LPIILYNISKVLYITKRFTDRITYKEKKMNKQLDLKNTEKASFKLATYTDGTADISLGLVFTLLGIYPFTRELLGPAWNFPLFLAALGLIVVFQMLVKRRLGPSRIGIVKLGGRIQKRLKASLLVMIALLALTVLTWVGAAGGFFATLPPLLGSYGMEIIVALIVLAIFWAIAYTLEMRRYYLYGVLLAVCFPLQQILSIYDGTPYLIAGGIITGIGVYLMSRFLQEYPDAYANAEEV
jgi:hypothetical protein